MCFLLSFLIGFVFVPGFIELTTKTVKVAVASRDISCGVAITELDIKEVEMNKASLPDDVILNKNDIIGKYAISDVLNGYYFTHRTISSELISPEAKIRSMKADEAVVPVSLDGSINALMRFLPNDIVSFYSVDSKTGVSSVIPELEYVSVVCESTESDFDITVANQKASDGSVLTPSKIKFILNNKQTLKLLSEQSTKTIYILLVRRSTDKEANAKLIAEQEAILKGGI